MCWPCGNTISRQIECSRLKCDVCCGNRWSEEGSSFSCCFPSQLRMRKQQSQTSKSSSAWTPSVADESCVCSAFKSRLQCPLPSSKRWRIHNLGPGIPASRRSRVSSWSSLGLPSPTKLSSVRNCTSRLILSQRRHLEVHWGDAAPPCREQASETDEGSAVAPADAMDLFPTSLVSFDTGHDDMTRTIRTSNCRLQKTFHFCNFY